MRLDSNQKICESHCMPSLSPQPEYRCHNGFNSTAMYAFDLVCLLFIVIQVASASCFIWPKQRGKNCNPFVSWCQQNRISSGPSNQYLYCIPTITMWSELWTGVRCNHALMLVKNTLRTHDYAYDRFDFDNDSDKKFIRLFGKYIVREPSQFGEWNQKIEHILVQSCFFSKYYLLNRLLLRSVPRMSSTHLSIHPHFTRTSRAHTRTLHRSPDTFINTILGKRRKIEISLWHFQLTLNWGRYRRRGVNGKWPIR